MADRWTTPFGAWVRSYGVRNLTQAMKERGQPVRKEAIFHWVAGRARPRPAAAKMLVAISCGALTLEHIYNQPAAAIAPDVEDALVENREAASRITSAAFPGGILPHRGFLPR